MSGCGWVMSPHYMGNYQSNERGFRCHPRHLRSCEPMSIHMTQQQHSVKRIVLPKGSRIFLGSPRIPIDEEILHAIQRVVSRVRGIAEAYLPQCYVEGVIDPPHQVLFVVVKEPEIPAILQELFPTLERELPRKTELDVIPLTAKNRVLLSLRKSWSLQRVRLLHEDSQEQ
jgi:hypothetical protein